MLAPPSTETLRHGGKRFKTGVPTSDPFVDLFSGPSNLLKGDLQRLCLQQIKECGLVARFTYRFGWRSLYLGMNRLR